MNVRKAVIATVAASTAALLVLTPSTQASSPTGSDITQILVNGNGTAGTVPVSGSFKSGTMTFDALGFTTSCAGGTAAGNVNRGPFTSGGTVASISTFTLTCPTPLGINSVIALNAGCVVNLTAGNVKQSPLNDNVHAGLIDSGKWAGSTSKPKLHNVLGRANIASKCLTKTLTGSSCTARADGNVAVEFDEAIKTVSGVNYQELMFKGSGLVLRNQTPACLGIVAGSITLNQMKFNLPTTTSGAIDFR
ncbi:MAG TPA: hypothetical protein VMF51_18810 [Nocardioides sp.]|uniref:hypothetical protein n=1 Tax=Nocardioides sp. TaxID=35761 RepID=UPI002D1BDEC1|nr:hypothetical protein [Nocardioides sp.]HTW17188.1 hypothetical protein [Nocardioides sp.]